MPAARRRWPPHAGGSHGSSSSATGFLGGTATAAMVGPWMTFHSGDDRIVGGIAQEIVERLIAARRLARAHSRLVGLCFEHHALRSRVHKALLFDLMREAGVDLLLHAYFFDALRDPRAPCAARASPPSAGCATTRAAHDRRDRRCVRRRQSAGVELQQGDARGRVQPASLMFRLSHVDIDATCRITCARIPIRCGRRSRRMKRDAARDHCGRRSLRVVGCGARARRGRRAARTRLVLHLAVPRRGHGQHDARDRHRSARSRRSRREPKLWRARKPPSCSLFLAPRSGFRERAHRRDRGPNRHPRVAPHRRRVYPDARRRLDARTFRGRRRAQRLSDRHPQSVGQRERRRSVCRPARPTRFRIAAWCPVASTRLLVAGRCISTTHEALASTRLTPTVMTLGQAAGTAAAIAVREGSGRATYPGRSACAFDRDGVDLRRAAPAAP